MWLGMATILPPLLSRGRDPAVPQPSGLDSTPRPPQRKGRRCAAGHRRRGWTAGVGGVPATGLDHHHPPSTRGGGRLAVAPPHRFERLADLLRLLECLPLARLPPAGVRAPAVLAQERGLGHVPGLAFARDAARLRTRAFCGRSQAPWSSLAETRPRRAVGSSARRPSASRFRAFRASVAARGGAAAGPVGAVRGGMIRRVRCLDRGP